VEAGTKIKETNDLERGLRAIRWDKYGNHRTAKRRRKSVWDSYVYNSNTSTSIINCEAF